MRDSLIYGIRKLFLNAEVDTKNVNDKELVELILTSAWHLICGHRVSSHWMAELETAIIDVAPCVYEEEDGE